MFIIPCTSQNTNSITSWLLCYVRIFGVSSIIIYRVIKTFLHVKYNLHGQLILLGYQLSHALSLYNFSNWFCYVFWCNTLFWVLRGFGIICLCATAFEFSKSAWNFLLLTEQIHYNFPSHSWVLTIFFPIK